MKRLMSKIARNAVQSFKHKRLMRVAEWVDVDVNDPGLVQQITDIMASGGQIQIQYKGEWKLISPYGWNSSQEGNILLMCYKDTGEVRSYRLDRIEAVQIDSSQVDPNATGSPLDTGLDSPADSEFDVPETEDGPSIELQEELPFDDELEALDVALVEVEPQTNEVQEEQEEQVDEIEPQQEEVKAQ